MKQKKMKETMNEKLAVSRAVRHRIADEIRRSKWIQMRANKAFIDRVAFLASRLRVKSRSRAIEIAVEKMIASMNAEIVSNANTIKFSDEKEAE